MNLHAMHFRALCIFALYALAFTRKQLIGGGYYSQKHHFTEVQSQSLTVFIFCLFLSLFRDYFCDLFLRTGQKVLENW